MHVQKQIWSNRFVYLFVTEGGSVQLDIYQEHQDDNIYAYIHHLYVDEDCRRKGIAKELLDAAENLAKQKGKDAVYLDYVEEYTPQWMYDYYIRRGYKCVESTSKYSLMKFTF